MFRIFLLMLCLLPALSSKGSELITRLSKSNVNMLQPGGPDAVGGLDDWLLSNGTLCAVVSDVAHESGLMAWGGSLVDLYHCEQRNDQWSFHHVIPNIDKDLPFKPVLIERREFNGRPILHVEFSGLGLHLVSRYSFVPGSPTQLRAEHLITRHAEGEALTMLGLLVLHPHTTLAPFSLSTQYPRYSQGFSYPKSDMNDTLSVVDAMVPADIHVYVGDTRLGEVSYGIQTSRAVLRGPLGESEELSVFQQTAPTYSMHGVFSRSPWIGGEGKPGLLEFAQSQLMDVEIGETLQVEQTFYLGSKSDVAAIADQLYTGPLLTGSTDLKNVVVHIEDNAGHAVSSVRTDRDGRFSARLPEGSKAVRLKLRTPGSTEVAEYVFDVTSPLLEVGELAAGALAHLPIQNELPVRLTFIGQNGTADPDFYDSGLTVSFGGTHESDISSANYLSFAGLEGDVKEAKLAPGNYRVIASRGMAYGMTEMELHLKAGANPPLVVRAPMREVGTDDLYAADFHVHSAPSFDSSIPVAHRLRSFAAQGGDVLIATEHNVLVDYQSIVQHQGFHKRLSVIGGIELTGMARTPSAPFTNGHLNVFPVTAKATAFSGGIPKHEGRRLRDLYASFAYEGAAPLFQLNHPRTAQRDSDDVDGNFFEHLYFGQPFQPSQPLTAGTNQQLLEKDANTGLRDLDFDLLEVANGPYYDNYKRVQADWFALLNQGERIVASANSDTHGTRQLVAIPQNFVALTQFTEESFLNAVKQGRLFGTTGPLLHVYLEADSGAAVHLGDTLTGDSFVLNITVQAASWVPVSELTVFVNGDVSLTRAIKAGNSIRLPMSVAKDSYVVVEVNGKANARYHELAPDFQPFAFTNPIYIDANQDGQWTAPGLEP